jgi:hypothetical protein
MPGHEFCRVLRNNEFTRDIGIFALSTNTAGPRELFIDNGADGYAQLNDYDYPNICKEFFSFFFSLGFIRFGPHWTNWNREQTTKAKSILIIETPEGGAHVHLLRFVFENLGYDVIVSESQNLFEQESAICLPEAIFIMSASSGDWVDTSDCIKKAIPEKVPHVIVTAFEHHQNDENDEIKMGSDYYYLDIPFNFDSIRKLMLQMSI